MERHKRVCAHVDLDAVESNIAAYRKNVPAETKFIAVIKTDAYGHGALPIARLLEENADVSGYAVATAEEALALTESGVQKPVLILGYVFPDAYDALLAENVRIPAFREDTLTELSEAAGRAGREAIVHIPVDTGMSRIGVFPDESGLSFVRSALLAKGVRVEGLFTHFTRADERDKTSAKAQLARFLRFKDEIKEKLSFTFPVLHAANSAAAMELPEAHLTYDRLGISLYGISPSDEMEEAAVCRALTPVLSLTSHIVFVKRLPAGTPVSYGGTYVTKRDTLVATVPVGYGDGYPRGLSGKGEMLVRGKRAPIMGRVCMDQCMIDVTEIPNVAEGDLATLIGRDGEERVTAKELGALSGRFPYELVCDIGKRVPRAYYRGGKEI